ncbi:calcium/calmodulin-dependent protein kinase type II delta chain isoform X16 [Oopsacas minuta]|uniref:calcium/calmodulin-dependent protein kinase n=1 Tax=Oopsacas minuta TaxID=111878 RepID=A0AAV7JJF9_9METZ|nr:calcium/calmodulin-dependent protein kinase type II delta chain isoform X16 [Oopsacas minuta]
MSKPIPISDKFANKFEVLEGLGKGAFSIVKKCRGKQGEVTGKEFAVKIIKTKELTAKILAKLEKESRICKTLKHPNIVSLHYSYQEDNTFYMVLDLVTGGELFDDIVKREYYSESQASNCLRQVLQALQFCHERNIIHRDIKPENLLLTSKHQPSNIKLADFGLAVELEKSIDFAWYGFAGTPGYLSPEILQKVPYGRPVDLWACGVILYILLVGYPPFWHDDQQKLYASIRNGEYDFPSPDWDTVTDEAKTLVTRLLTRDPMKRLTAGESLKQSWIFTPELPSKFHRQGTIDGLRSFNARRKLRGAVISTILSNQLIRTLGAHKEAQLIPGPKPVSAEMIINLTKKLIDSIKLRDWETYSTLCDAEMTCFEPECRQQIVGGLQFHKFYFENSRGNLATPEYEILKPNVKLFKENGAVISYIKKVTNVSESGEIVSHDVKETRVWNMVGGKWKCIHFHRSSY